MRIAVFGAAGRVGSRVVAEAASRGHEVTAVARDAARLQGLPDTVHLRSGDAARVEDVVALSTGQDVVVSATRPAPGHEPDLVSIAKTVLAGVVRTGARLLVVGGASSLLLPGKPGVRLMDDPSYPSSLAAIGAACAEQLAVCRAETRVDWAYLSPPASFAPGPRTGRYRLGGDELLVDESGRSRISMEDFAVALVDEIERPMHHRQRFTVAY